MTNLTLTCCFVSCHLEDAAGVVCDTAKPQKYRHFLPALSITTFTYLVPALCIAADLSDGWDMSIFNFGFVAFVDEKKTLCRFHLPPVQVAINVCIPTENICCS